VSVAEAARRARANKGTTTKAVKSYDDDNFVRSAPIAKKNAADKASENTSAPSPSEEMKGKVVCWISGHLGVGLAGAHGRK
jgi:hypothetical protein